MCLAQLALWLWPSYTLSLDWLSKKFSIKRIGFIVHACNNFKKKKKEKKKKKKREPFRFDNSLHLPYYVRPEIGKWKNKIKTRTRTRTKAVYINYILVQQKQSTFVREANGETLVSPIENVGTCKCHFPHGSCSN